MSTTEEFLGTARQALRRDPGTGALDALGWWELLGDLDDQDLRTGAFSLFRAHGRELANTAALGAVLATPYLEALGAEPGSAVAAVLHSSPRRGDVPLLLGDAAGRDVLVDIPGRPPRFLTVPSGARRRELPGRLTVTELDPDRPGRPIDLGETQLRGIRQRALAIGRIAAAAEMLGTAEGAVALAVAHAGIREQFGAPIGTFQAVRHLLARAETDTVALAAAVRQAVRGLPTLPAHHDEVVKALAGRNARNACESALQVLGAIGFTAEHDHHHHHSRVLLLDALLGTSAALTRRLGARVRETGTTPALTQHALACVD